jgi:beta-glucanase (GH16 family)
MKMRAFPVLAVLIAVFGGALIAFHAVTTKYPTPASGSSPSFSSRPPQLTLPGRGWRLIFNTDFSGTRLNTSVWNTCYQWTNPASGCTNFGNTEEDEWYLPSQDRVYNGILHLVAQPIPTRGQNVHGEPKEYMCRSGMVTSYPGLRFTYGIVQIVARIPSTDGLWSALWLEPADLKSMPEIDILERWGQPDAHTGLYFHPAGGPRVGARAHNFDLAVGWHTFTLDWTPSSLTWFIDGKDELSTQNYIPHQMMYLLANVANFNLQSADSCNGAMLIRSIKVWQRTDS